MGRSTLPTGAGRPEAKRWEYHYAAFNPLDQSPLAAWLNAQGAVGWELIMRDHGTGFIFKRERV
jgi:hypothetical protein